MKRKLFFVFLVGLVAIFIFSFFLRNVWGQFDGQRKLVKIPSHPLFDGLQCGEYFVLVSDDEGRPMIGFVFEVEPMVLEERAFLPEEIFVATDDRKSVPTIQFTKKGKIKVILRISKDGLKGSPCLQRCFDGNRT